MLAACAYVAIRNQAKYATLAPYASSTSRVTKMLQKLIKIKNIGRFRDCSPRGDVTFRKLTLLFAENGRGKTTLCAILRSLQTGQQEFILERKTLGTCDPSSVQIRIGGNIVTFKANEWSTTYPDITIFDSVFVHDHVYAGDYVDHDHKKNLYRVIVGAQGVQLPRQIEDLDGKIREANRDINEKKGIVSRTLPSGVALDAYLAWQPVEDVENRIQLKNTEIDNRQRISARAEEVQAKGLLAKITLPALPLDFLDILARQLKDIAADAEVRVRKQIAAHDMHNHGEAWLSQGLGFVANDNCPFCGQNLNVNELISAYRSYFNATYKDMKQEVAQLSERINSSIGPAALNVVQQALSSNLTLLEFWKQFTLIVLPAVAFDDIAAKYATLRDLALALAAGKRQVLTESVSPSVDFQAALEAVVGLQQSLLSYNAAVDTCNSSINEQKTAANQVSNINALKKELSDLEARKKRFEPDVMQACKDYRDVCAAKATHEGKKAAAREQLDQHCLQIIRTYEQAINDYLDQFNAGFKITNSRHLYTGGTPSSHYQIEINSSAVDLGHAQTQPGTPSFKTTLSSGDRSALALAFFLAAIKQGSGIANKIVILDDPFTSQDRFRRTCTQQLIRQLAADAKQVIVLSHDPHFLKLIWEGQCPADVRVLQMCCAGDGTIIEECDIEAETQSIYLKNYATLLDFYRDRKGAPLAVARSIRPFIEGWLRAHFPGRFPPDQWLGDFIGKIRNAPDTDGLFHAKPDLAKIEAINDYSKRFHHDQNPNADFSYESPRPAS